MSTIDTSSWNPDADLNTAIEGIPLNSDAGIAQTWKVIAILMAAHKGDAPSAMEGATASADGASGLVPQPLAGDQDKVLRGDGTWGDNIVGNAATATRLAGPKHSYTTAANAAKNWYRIANANTSQIDPDTPLHAQFFIRMNASAAGVGYWQSWFVDVEVCGQQSGIRIFGNSSTAPFSQARVLYENTAASVTTSVRPAIDIYLNYVLEGGTVVEVEEVYNSGFDFVADGVLATSVVPSGYENRASSPYGAGVNNAAYADYANLLNTNISANTTLNTSTHTRRPLSCTGTITLTLASVNSSSLWYLIKNYGTGIVTLHPASTSVMFDNVSADVTLQPGEFVRLACQSNNHYSIIDDGRWKSQKAEASHVHGSITNDGKLGTASRAVVTDADGVIDVSSVTATELGYLSGVASAIQTQLDGKAADSAAVHVSGSESIAGVKTFSSNIRADALRGTNAGGAGSAVFEGGASGTAALLQVYGRSHASYPGEFFLRTRASNGSLGPVLNGLPDGTLTWNGQAIQTSSDERLKTPLATVQDDVLDAWEAVCWGQFRFLDAVERKGEAARLHLGLIAQRVKAVFEARGLDACAYGILCHEERGATEDAPASDIWMVRYEEALAMEAAFQRRRADRLEARIKALEEAMNA